MAPGPEYRNVAKGEGMWNFRDVGEWINVIVEEEVLVEKWLYRGDAIGDGTSLAAIGSPRTIFNLTREQHPRQFDGVKTYQFSLDARADVYKTDTDYVKNWLRGIVGTLERGTGFPLYVHCNAGVDRTGVVIGGLLTILDIDQDSIAREYALSYGAPPAERIISALEPLSDLDRYFRRIDLDAVRDQLLAGERRQAK